jgi:hypothetical protein
MLTLPVTVLPSNVKLPVFSSSLLLVDVVDSAEVLFEELVFFVGARN